MSVHPHTRGDNNAAPLFNNTTNGSPPHTWGQCRNLFFFLHFLRFTPTHVGTINICSSPIGFCTGSPPHTWGQCEYWWYREDRVGSPPHTWGQYLLFCLMAVSKRFTPTHVGTIAFDSRGCHVAAVHPHTRGDN